MPRKQPFFRILTGMLAASLATPSSAALSDAMGHSFQRHGAAAEASFFRMQALALEPESIGLAGEPNQALITAAQGIAQHLELGAAQFKSEMAQMLLTFYDIDP